MSKPQGNPFTCCFFISSDFERKARSVLLSWPRIEGGLGQEEYPDHWRLEARKSVTAERHQEVDTSVTIGRALTERWLEGRKSSDSTDKCICSNHACVQRTNSTINKSEVGCNMAECAVLV